MGRDDVERVDDGGLDAGRLGEPAEEAGRDPVAHRELADLEVVGRLDPGVGEVRERVSGDAERREDERPGGDAALGEVDGAALELGDPGDGGGVAGGVAGPEGGPLGRGDLAGDPTGLAEVAEDVVDVDPLGAGLVVGRDEEREVPVAEVEAEVAEELGERAAEVRERLDEEPARGDLGLTERGRPGRDRDAPVVGEDGPVAAEVADRLALVDERAEEGEPADVELGRVPRCR